MIKSKTRNANGVTIPIIPQIEPLITPTQTLVPCIATVITITGTPLQQGVGLIVSVPTTIVPQEIFALQDGDYRKVGVRPM
jgi:hypothetical protein